MRTGYTACLDAMATDVLKRLATHEGQLTELVVSRPPGVESAEWSRAVSARLSQSGVDFVVVRCLEDSDTPSVVGCTFEPGWAP